MIASTNILSKAKKNAVEVCLIQTQKEDCFTWSVTNMDKYDRDHVTTTSSWRCQYPEHEYKSTGRKAKWVVQSELSEEQTKWQTSIKAAHCSHFYVYNWLFLTCKIQVGSKLPKHTTKGSQIVLSCFHENSYQQNFYLNGFSKPRVRLPLTIYILHFYIASALTHNWKWDIICKGSDKLAIYL